METKKKLNFSESMQIREYEKLQFQEDRLKMAREIFDKYIMIELLACSHVSIFTPPRLSSFTVHNMFLCVLQTITVRVPLLLLFYHFIIFSLSLLILLSLSHLFFFFCLRAWLSSFFVGKKCQNNSEEHVLNIFFCSLSLQVLWTKCRVQ